MESIFSKNLEELRLERGLSQAKVAKALGISEGNYSSLKSGLWEPSLKVIIAVSQFYNVSIDWLLTGDEYIISSKYDSFKEFTEYEIELLRIIRNVTDEEKELIKMFIYKFKS